MFLETTPEGKIYKELAADHFADPKGLGKYALFLRPSQGDLIPAPQMEPSLLLSGRYRPIPTLQSIDVMEKVIYINTFSKSLAPAFRISYLVLPKHLVTRFYETLGFYSGTVSCLEQMTLARFLSEGYFEKHINRMRNHYRALRDKLLLALRQSPLAGRVKISEEHAGLHFLLELDTQRSDEEILQAAQDQDLRISFVSQYYVAAQNRRPHVLVMNYSGLEEEKVEEAVSRLCRAVLG